MDQQQDSSGNGKTSGGDRDHPVHPLHARLRSHQSVGGEALNRRNLEHLVQYLGVTKLGLFKNWKKGKHSLGALRSKFADFFPPEGDDRRPPKKRSKKESNYVLYAVQESTVSLIAALEGRNLVISDDNMKVPGSEEILDGVWLHPLFKRKNWDLYETWKTGFSLPECSLEEARAGYDAKGKCVPEGKWPPKGAPTAEDLVVRASGEESIEALEDLEPPEPNGTTADPDPTPAEPSEPAVPKGPRRASKKPSRDANGEVATRMLQRATSDMTMGQLREFCQDPEEIETLVGILLQKNGEDPR